MTLVKVFLTRVFYESEPAIGCFGVMQRPWLVSLPPKMDDGMEREARRNSGRNLSFLGKKSLLFERKSV